MVDQPDLTEAERKALAALAAARNPDRPKKPISASFRARMASTTVDPYASTSDDPPKADGADGLVIIRP